MPHDCADSGISEAAGYWGFAAWAHKPRRRAVDAFARRPAYSLARNQKHARAAPTARRRAVMECDEDCGGDVALGLVEDFEDCAEDFKYLAEFFKSAAARLTVVHHKLI